MMRALWINSSSQINRDLWSSEVTDSVLDHLQALVRVRGGGDALEQGQDDLKLLAEAPLADLLMEIINHIAGQNIAVCELIKEVAWQRSNKFLLLCMYLLHQRPQDYCPCPPRDGCSTWPWWRSLHPSLWTSHRTWRNPLKRQSFTCQRMMSW